LFYTIYKTTNTINGKTYIGKHQTKNLDDGYLGSGVKLLRDKRVYGRENFKKDILFVFETKEQMNIKERELVCISKETYNLAIGGGGGNMYGKTHSEITRQKMRDNHWSKQGSCSNRKGAKLSDETKAKIGKASATRVHSSSTKERISSKLIGRKRPPNTIQKMRKPKSEAHKQAIALALRGKPKSPEAIANMRLSRWGE